MIDDNKLALIDAAAAGRIQQQRGLPEWEDHLPTPLRRHDLPVVQLTQASQLNIAHVRWLWPG